METNGAFVPVVRPRVVERLRLAARQPILLIAAPAGYGKSVALAQFLATRREPWMRFDPTPEHAALLGFLRGLSGAIAPYAPHAGTSLAGAYERSRASSVPAKDLALWMHAHLRGFRGILAIDDVHVAEGDPSVAEFLVALIERTKVEMRWVISTRSTAGLPVGTWLAYGDADLAIDERDLCFTFEEAKEAARESRLMIGDQEVGELLELTDGWPTAFSFALRTSTRSTDLRSITATTREMIYRYFAEQVYAEFSREERDLLAVATALPAIDIDVLEAAGFDRALAIVEDLRERTAFIFTESPRVFRCHDLFKDFIRREIEREGSKRFEQMQLRAGGALEATGDIEHALIAYVHAASRGEILRVLNAHGFDLLERARGDIVARAIDSLDENTRREDARILLLRGMLHATAGRSARAEALLSRAIARAGADRELAAVASLRLAIQLTNLGRDTDELLEKIADDASCSKNRRAEALSISTAQSAAAGELDKARRGIEQIRTLLAHVDSDQTRAKVLQRLGVALTNIGVIGPATTALQEAAEIATELHMFSLSSRAYSALSNLALHEEDDVAKQLDYARMASIDATKAGDAFDLRTSLSQMLSAEMRLGNAERSREIEVELAQLSAVDLGLAAYPIANRALRAGWEGRFAEAHRLLSGCYDHIYFEIDRIAATVHCSLYLALLERRDESIALVREATERLDRIDARGVYRVRAAAVARMICSVAEAIVGRTTRAEQLARRIARDADPIVTLCTCAATSFASARRTGSVGSSDLLEVAEALNAFSYGDIAQLLRASAADLQSRAKAATDGLLTRAERKILKLLADGETPKEIALANGRSVYTIQAHIANAIAKLGCHGRGEAIAISQRRGWLE